MGRKTVVAACILFLSIAAGTQLSITTVGSKHNGATGIVRRSDQLSYLNFIDSAQAACRSGRSSFSSSGDGGNPYGPLASMGRREYCEGGTAIQIADSGKVLLRMPYMQLVTDLSLVGSR